VLLPYELVVDDPTLGFLVLAHQTIDAGLSGKLFTDKLLGRVLFIQEVSMSDLTRRETGVPCK